MRKPEFLIAGVQKSGTTYLDSLVRNHKNIYLPERTLKYSFFDDKRIFSKGINWYLDMFSNAPEVKLVGQTSADCSFEKDAIGRILDFNPDMKLIFMIREPVSRTYSHYWHQVKMSREHLDFNNALKSEKSRIKKSYYNLKKYSYVERSKYKRQFESIYERINDNQLLIIPFESFIADELKFLNTIFSFLGVERIQSIDEVMPKNRSTNPSKLPPKILRKYSYLFRWSKFTRLLFSKTLKVSRPPMIIDSDKEFLEILLKEDIDFYNEIKNKYK